jgi:hypothetical protein
VRFSLARGFGRQQIRREASSTQYYSGRLQCSVT